MGRKCATMDNARFMRSFVYVFPLCQTLFYIYTASNAMHCVPLYRLYYVLYINTHSFGIIKPRTDYYKLFVFVFMSFLLHNIIYLLCLLFVIVVVCVVCGTVEVMLIFRFNFFYISNECVCESS